MREVKRGARERKRGKGVLPSGSFKTFVKRNARGRMVYKYEGIQWHSSNDAMLERNNPGEQEENLSKDIMREEKEVSDREKVKGER